MNRIRRIKLRSKRINNSRPKTYKKRKSLEVRRVEVIQDKNETEVAFILKQKLQKIYNNSEGKPTIIQRDKKGYLILGKTKAGISMRQMYLEEKGYDFEK